MQPLQRPARSDEPAGQVVEQFRVGGPLAQLAEVAGRGNQAPAEVAFPDPVHHHPGGQRVLGTGNGPGQFEPPAPLRERRRGRRAREDREEPPRGLRAQRRGIAAQVDPHVRDRLSLRQAVDHRVLRRRPLSSSGQARPEAAFTTALAFALSSSDLASFISFRRLFSSAFFVSIWAWASS